MSLSIFVQIWQSSKDEVFNEGISTRTATRAFPLSDSQTLKKRPNVLTPFLTLAHKIGHNSEMAEATDLKFWVKLQNLMLFYLK